MRPVIGERRNSCRATGLAKHPYARGFQTNERRGDAFDQCFRHLFVELELERVLYLRPKPAIGCLGATGLARKVLPRSLSLVDQEGEFFRDMRASDIRQLIDLWFPEIQWEQLLEVRKIGAAAPSKVRFC